LTAIEFGHKFASYGLSGKPSLRRKLITASALQVVNSAFYPDFGGISAIGQIGSNLAARPQSG
jgi:hypothetical protein